MTHLLETCVICIALLVVWMAYTIGYESGWLLVYWDQTIDLIDIAAGIAVVASALVQLAKGVLQ